MIFIGIISLLIPIVLEQGKNLSLLNVNNFEIKVNALFDELSSYLSTYNIDFDNYSHSANFMEISHDGHVFLSHSYIQQKGNTTEGF